MSYVILWPKMLIMVKFVKGESLECSISQEDYVKKETKLRIERKF